MGRVVYLTGAPATGKSTLSAMLKNACPNLEIFSYSRRLIELVNREGAASPLTEVTIREQSAHTITKRHIEQLDAELISFVKTKRASVDVLIDSHPVTSEEFGFRVTAFSASQILQLSPDAILCLYAMPETLRLRIQQNAQGRRLPSEYDLAMNNQLQTSVASQYGVISGATVYVINSAVDQNELLSHALRAAKFASP